MRMEKSTPNPGSENKFDPNKVIGPWNMPGYKSTERGSAEKEPAKTSENVPSITEKAQGMIRGAMVSLESSRKSAENAKAGKFAIQPGLGSPEEQRAKQIQSTKESLENSQKEVSALFLLQQQLEKSNDDPAKALVSITEQMNNIRKNLQYFESRGDQPNMQKTADDLNQYFRAKSALEKMTRDQPS